MSDILYVHVEYWIIILIIVLIAFLIYIKQKKKNRQLKESLYIEHDSVSKIDTLVSPFEQKQLLFDMPSNDDDWQYLESRFDNAYNGFIRKLRNCYPLSNEDVHLIILICLGVGNKQIASYYHIQLASLATHRYRIAKKMGLKETKSINEAILGMLKNGKC
ncbi:helix-turn-helix transcriptional regulator [Bacteroides salyersiae]|jgi:hypothetical protein|uniref:helix-turn-helix transcriptional regulator n=1 Tax=Bacteroides salyersiae TaxID=291644 RepID=UPI001C8B4402|nr:hypothetical protein [Bacteroides salyersiae]